LAWPKDYLAMPVIEKSGVESQQRFFSIVGILKSTLDRVARYAIEFLVLFRNARELKVDYSHVCVNLMHCFSSVRTVLFFAVSLNKMYIKQKASN